MGILRKERERVRKRARVDWSMRLFVKRRVNGDLIFISMKNWKKFLSLSLSPLSLGIRCVLQNPRLTTMV